MIKKRIFVLSKRSIVVLMKKPLLVMLGQMMDPLKELPPSFTKKIIVNGVQSGEVIDLQGAYYDKKAFKWIFKTPPPESGLEAPPPTAELQVFSAIKSSGSPSQGNLSALSPLPPTASELSAPENRDPWEPIQEGGTPPGFDVETPPSVVSDKLPPIVLKDAAEFPPELQIPSERLRVAKPESPGSLPSLNVPGKPKTPNPTGGVAKLPALASPPPDSASASQDDPVQELSEVYDL